MARLAFLRVWSKVDSVEGAVEASKAGFVAAMICAALTGIAALSSAIGSPLKPGYSLGALLDAGAFAALGWGTYRLSRVCAVLLVLFYTAEKLDSLAHITSLPIAGVVVIAGVYALYFRGVYGTISYHQLKAAAAERVPDA